jgi:hypothetical protein
MDFPLAQVESLSIKQSLLDRIFGAAQVRVSGSGSSWVQTALLANYREFRNAAAEQAERFQGGGSSGGPVAGGVGKG